MNGAETELDVVCCVVVAEAEVVIMRVHPVGPRYFVRYGLLSYVVSQPRANLKEGSDVLTKDQGRITYQLQRIAADDVSYYLKVLVRNSEFTFMAVETIKSCVVTVTSVGRIALYALAVVAAWNTSIETLSSTVPPYPLFFIYFPLKIKGNTVHPQSSKTPQERSQRAVGCT